ncbi:hypothetical protein [Pandoraea horticolens]|uniref:hypothetical protein n=1 Tax=Pandoraea horticolens TaxID=2508298 RepID=UPI00124085C5|nr:hypothetical protein [Pandoraea horticolens]
MLKLESSDQKFTLLGNVARLNGFGPAGVVSPNGKHHFVAVTEDILNGQGGMLLFHIGSLTPKPKIMVDSSELTGLMNIVIIDV